MLLCIHICASIPSARPAVLQYFLLCLRLISFSLASPRQLRHLTVLSGILTMPKLPNTLKDSTVVDSICRRLSESEIASDHYPRMAKNETGYIPAAVDHPSQISRGKGIVLAASVTLLLLGVVFIALLVQPRHPITSRRRTSAQHDLTADDTRFTAHQKRAVSGSLVASESSRHSSTPQQDDRIMHLLRNSPREVYTTWAARTEVSSPDKLPTDPLW
jgi:hypothetical protein